MNRALIDPFVLAQEYPEQLTHRYHWGNACCVTFSPQGDYLAVGLVEGAIEIVDTDTWGTLAALEGHVAPIQSFSWSEDGRYLLSASRDWQCILWDMSTTQPLHKINVGGPAWQAQVRAGHHQQFVAARYEAAPVFGDMERGAVTELDAVEGKCQVAIFDPSGRFILCGNSKGDLAIFDADSLDLVKVDRTAKGSIRSLYITPRGDSLVINSSDRMIKIVEMPASADQIPEWDFPVKNKFIDAINRFQWGAVTTTPSGEYLLATTVDNSHNVYMWESTSGTLARIYECPEEEVLALAFHPTETMLVATGMDTGAVYQWTQNVPQQWSSLAPDFGELQDNEPYYEKEDEFDIDDDDMAAQIVPVGGPVDVFTSESRRSDFVIPVRVDCKPVSKNVQVRGAKTKVPMAS